MKNDVFSLLCHQEYLTHRLWLSNNLAAFAAKVRILIQDTKSIGLNLHISRLFCNFAVASKDFTKDQSAGQKVVVK